jgi:hypothetical protein
MPLVEPKRLYARKPNCSMRVIRPLPSSSPTCGRDANRSPIRNFRPSRYMRQKLDASLVSLEPEDQECLREAAWWATALCAQELCDQKDDWTSKPAALECPDGTPRLQRPEVLMDTGTQSMCAARIEELIREQELERARNKTSRTRARYVGGCKFSLLLRASPPKIGEAYAPFHVWQITRPARRRFGVFGDRRSVDH